LNPLLVVTGREIRETLRHRAFWVINAVLFLGALAAVVVPTLLSSGSHTDTVATANAPPAFVHELRRVHAGSDHGLEVVAATDHDDVRQRVDDGTADVGVSGDGAPRVVVQAAEHAALVGEVQQALARAELTQRLHDAGLDAAQVRHVTDVGAAPVESLQADAGTRRAVAVVAATVLYVLLIGLTISVANGVAIEKANRISEVLLAIVPPRPLLFGKVIGVGLMGVATLVIGAAPIVVRFLVGGDLPAGTGAVLAAGAAWFALGVAFYLVVSGALAALVERQEQVGSATGPLMAVLIGSLIVAQSAPESGFAAVLAYVPFSAPVVEPARIAVSASSPVEMALSLALLVAGLVIAVRSGGLVFQRAIVRTGRRLKLLEVLRAT
jgi:ABC-2 type transport system permease protein